MPASLSDTQTARVRQLRILDIPVCDVSMQEALALLERMLSAQPQRAHSVYFVNAHTLNVGYGDQSYRAVLQEADCVFGDGTGVRWAARMLHGIQLKDNVNGTDLVPLMFAQWADKGLRYFLLGNSPERIERAAAYAREAFPGWTLAGWHHGYVAGTNEQSLVGKINASGAHVLLVGMGNPKQEQWIHSNRSALRVPLCLGIGGLFDYWAGALSRAPAWMRRMGYEWLHLMIRQPHKAKRYLIGNPVFLMRVARSRPQR